MQIPFPNEERTKYYRLLDEVFDSNFWSEGQMIRRFEADFSAFVGADARTVSNGGAGLLAILQYINAAGGEVVVPTNTFWATTRAVEIAGAKPVFADVAKADLCLSLETLEACITPRTRAVIVVHIGGHIAFEIEAITEFCNAKGIALVEDCAHAHGAHYNGRTAGTYGIAGAYSFYATKSLPLGEGGMVVSRDAAFIEWVERYRNYGKRVVDGQVTYPIQDGFNFRMPEMSAALGIVQLARFPEILDWKRRLAAKYDRIFENRVRFPDGMESGFYKYIVWDYDGIAERTGQVFGPNDLNHRIAESGVSLPVAEWIADHHQCVPIWHGWERADLSVEEIETYLLRGA